MTDSATGMEEKNAVNGLNTFLRCMFQGTLQIKLHSLNKNCNAMVGVYNWLTRALLCLRSILSRVCYNNLGTALYTFSIFVVSHNYVFSIIEILNVIKFPSNGVLLCLLVFYLL